MKKVLNKIKKDKKLQKKVLIIASIIIFVIITVLTIKNIYKVTPIEEIKLKEVSNEVMNYMEEIETSKSKNIDKYINYTLEYFYNEEDKETLHINEIKKFIEETFTVKITNKELKEIGITQEMLEKNIVYDPIKETYKKGKINLSYADIASKKIIKYNIEKITKKNKNEFVIEYRKYIVSNPYKILNYYMELNQKDEKNKIKYDTTEINNYLKGKEKTGVIKKYITNSNIKKVGKEKETVEVKYVVKDNKILVDTINTNNK